MCRRRNRRLRDASVTRFQGYLEVRPAVEALPEPDWAALA
jgi:hypothetical protein